MTLSLAFIGLPLRSRRSCPHSAHSCLHRNRYSPVLNSLDYVQFCKFSETNCRRFIVRHIVYDGHLPLSQPNLSHAITIASLLNWLGYGSLPIEVQAARVDYTDIVMDDDVAIGIDVVYSKDRAWRNLGPHAVRGYHHYLISRTELLSLFLRHNSIIAKIEATLAGATHSLGGESSGRSIDGCLNARKLRISLGSVAADKRTADPKAARAAKGSATLFRSHQQ